MGNTPLAIPALGSKFIDYRQQILGNSYTWAWVRPLSQPRYLAIHHTAGPDTQTPDEIAAFHVRSRGWGGIGYHFLISKNGTVYYVGDLSTARANVLNLNHLVIGICLIGNFTQDRLPTADQFRSTHLLCAHLLFHSPALTQINGWEDVVGHQQLGSTACPGTEWSVWRKNIISLPTPVTPPSGDTTTRTQATTKLYQVVLGREPDQAGLEFHVKSGASIEEIRRIMTESPEHQDLIRRAYSYKQLQQTAAESVPYLQQMTEKFRELTSQ